MSVCVCVCGVLGGGGGWSFAITPQSSQSWFCNLYKHMSIFKLKHVYT